MASEALKLETDRYLNISQKVSTEDIDWADARRVGASEDEKFILTYFSDIEGQTFNYMRDLMTTKAALEQEFIGFLTMWNYEEYFHGRVLAQFLKECGCDLGKDRIASVRRSASFSEILENVAAKVLSWIYRDEFPAVHAAWGAVQEITTLKGYEELASTTPNPVLKTLCERIAKQERRHFAWYFNSARERLERSPRAQKLTRFLLSRFWSPVGAGVKPDSEVVRLIQTLFQGSRCSKMATEIDAKIGSLPGLTGISLMRAYLEKVGEAPSQKPIALAGSTSVS